MLKPSIAYQKLSPRPVVALGSQRGRRRAPRNGPKRAARELRFGRTRWGWGQSVLAVYQW